MMKFIQLSVPVIGSQRSCIPKKKMRISANQKLGSAWPTTASDRAKRSIREFGRIAAATPSGMASASAKEMAQSARTMVLPRRSQMTSEMSAFR